MPLAAEHAAIGAALARDPGDDGGIEGIALGAVTALAGAHALPLVVRGLLHGRQEILTTEYTEYTE